MFLNNKSILNFSLEIGTPPFAVRRCIRRGRGVERTGWRSGSSGSRDPFASRQDRSDRQPNVRGTTLGPFHVHAALADVRPYPTDSSAMEYQLCHSGTFVGFFNKINGRQFRLFQVNYRILKSMNLFCVKEIGINCSLARQRTRPDAGTMGQRHSPAPPGTRLRRRRGPNSGSTCYRRTWRNFF